MRIARLKHLALDNWISSNYNKVNNTPIIMYVSSYEPGELSEALTLHGKEYIVRRFKDVWGIDRGNEITLASIQNRRNLIALEGSEVVGWLGVNEDGEIVNGCGGPGRSSYILITLLKHLFEDSLSVSHQFYAFVPIDYLASAACCIKAGMFLPDSIPPEFAVKAYGKKVVTLIKLVYYKTPESLILNSSQSQNEKLTQLKVLIKDYAKPSKPRQFLKSLLEIKKRFSDRLAFLSLHLGIDAELALKQFSLIPKILLCIPLSLFYYFVALQILGHDVQKHWDFLTQKKSEQDRTELVKYLEVSERALEKINLQVAENNKLITGFTGNEDKKVILFPFESILEKQKTSLELLSKIIAGYSGNLKKGIDSGEEPIALYTEVLRYMSSEEPYNLVDFTYRIHDEDIRPSCNSELCVRESLTKYVTRALKE
jgi:hypothetical protein